MFNAIIPLANPIVAVQVDAEQMRGNGGIELLAKLELYFMKPVVLVAWGEDSKFMTLGVACPESLLTDEDLQWRKFELPPEPEIPF